MASDEHKFRRLEKMLTGLGAVVERKTAIAEVLGAIDSEPKPETIIAEKTLFGAEADGLLKAIHKICPRIGLVIISRRPEEEELRQTEGYIFIEPDADEETWLDVLLKSRKMRET